MKFKKNRFKELRESITIDGKDTFVICTQDELTKLMKGKTGISILKPQISELENGKREPTIRELKAYSQCFNVSMEYLLGLSQNKRHENIMIGKLLGLSDSAIDTLRNWKKKKIGYSFLINTLISFGELFELLSMMDSYLFSKVIGFSATDYNGEKSVETDSVMVRTDNDGKLLTTEQLENFRIFALQNNLIKMKRILKENNIIKDAEDNFGYVDFCENEHADEEYAVRIKQIQMCKEDE